MPGAGCGQDGEKEERVGAIGAGRDQGVPAGEQKSESQSIIKAAKNDPDEIGE